MMPSAPFPYRVFAALVAVCVSSAPVRAEPQQHAPASAGARAVQSGDEGMARYGRGEWEAAFRAMVEAEQLYHSPVFLLYQARSARNAGHMLQAQTIFRRLNAEAVADTAPESWKRAQADARRELAALEQDIPSVVIITHDVSTAAAITLDGQPALAGQRIELDPGAHVLVVSDGARREEKAFTLAPGIEQERLVVALSKPQSTPTLPPARQPGPYRLPGMIAAATGGAALIAGAVLGGVAHAKASNVVDSLPLPQCEQGSCLPSARPEIDPRLDSARTLATTADVLLIGGATLAVAGAVLWIVDPGGTHAVEARVSASRPTLQIRF